MFANLAQLKSEFGVSGGVGGGINIDMGSILGTLDSEGPSAGPVHAFEILNAAKCSGNQGLMQAMDTADLMTECALGPLRILASIVNALMGMIGGALGGITGALGKIGQMIGALVGGIQSLACINLGIAQIHVQIQGQAQVAAGSITAGVGTFVKFDTNIKQTAERIKELVKDKQKLKEVIKQKALIYWNQSELARTLKEIKRRVSDTLTKTRGYIKQLDEKERSAMNTVDNILRTAHALKGLVCDIFALLRAFLSLFQSLSVTVGIQGTVVAEIVQVLQAILSVIASFFAALQDMLSFLTSLAVEAETISVKMFTNTLSSVKEKFRELGYAAMSLAGGPGVP